MRRRLEGPRLLERLRIGCQLTEAMATRSGPLHLAQVSGISGQAAIRYAVNAWQLPGSAGDHGCPVTLTPPGPLGLPGGGYGDLARGK